MTKLSNIQIPQQTELDKQGPWMHFAFKTYYQYAKNEWITLTHITYADELLKILIG